MAGRKGSRHGRNAAMVRVRLAGFRSVDRRMVAARTAMAWRSELLADLGGEESLTAARMALVESATRSWLFVQAIDAWLLGQTSLVNARRKGVHPVVKERLLLVESFQRTLLTLGLDRAQPKAPTLEAIAERLQAEREERALVTQEAPGAEQADSGHGWAPEPVESAGGVSAVMTGGRDKAPEPRMAEPVLPELAAGRLELAAPEEPGPVTDAVAAAAGQAASRILGTWSVLPERVPEPVEVPEF